MELSAAPGGAAGQELLFTSCFVGTGLDRNKVELRPALARTSASNVPIKSFYKPTQGWWRACYKAYLSKLQGLMTWQFNYQADLYESEGLSAAKNSREHETFTHWPNVLLYSRQQDI